ncbi:MAG: membrane protein insertion efficiency factor YidD [Candidatus Thiodiazotropha sp.]
MVDYILIKLINFYQKRISPHKGYRCAYSVYYGSESCSNYGKRIIYEHGWVFFLKNIYRRLVDCKQSSLMLNQMHNEPDNSGEEKESSKSDNCNPVEEPIACCINILPGK